MRVYNIINGPFTIRETVKVPAIRYRFPMHREFVPTLANNGEYASNIGKDRVSESADGFQGMDRGEDPTGWKWTGGDPLIRQINE